MAIKLYICDPIKIVRMNKKWLIPLKIIRVIGFTIFAYGVYGVFVFAGNSKCPGISIRGWLTVLSILLLGLTSFVLSHYAIKRK